MKINSPKQSHYFVTSVGEWFVTTDFQEIIKRTKKSNFVFSVWLVPGTVDTDYEINAYTPKVEGARYIAAIEPTM